MDCPRTLACIKTKREDQSLISPLLPWLLAATLCRCGKRVLHSLNLADAPKMPLWASLACLPSTPFSPSSALLCSELQCGRAGYSRWEFPGVSVSQLLNDFRQWKVLTGNKKVKGKCQSVSPPSSLSQISGSDNVSYLAVLYVFHSCSSLGHPTVLCLASQNSIICITNLHIKTGMVSIFPIRPWLVQRAGPLLVGLGSPVWAPRLQLCCPRVDAYLLLPQTRYRDRVTEAWGAPSLSPRQCWTRDSPLPLCPVPGPESPASVPCFPGELSLANLGQDFSPFNFWNRVIFPPSFEDSELFLQINLSSPQHPALCDKGHTVFYSSRSPGQWMPSALPYNRITKGGHRWRALLSGLLVTEDETGVQLSPPPWSLSCFSQAVFNHTDLYVTTSPTLPGYISCCLCHLM